MRLTKERSLGIVLVVGAVILFAGFYLAGMIANLLSVVDEVLVALVASMIIAGFTLTYHGKERESVGPRDAGSANAENSVAEQIRLQNEQAAAERRRQRYARLNESVLIPLRESRASPVPDVINHDPWNQLKLNYDLSQIRTSPFFDECRKHLEHDAPRVIASANDIESRASALNNRVNDYKNTTATSRVRQALEIVIEDRRDVRISESYTNRPNAVYLPGLMNFLSGSWIYPVVSYEAAGHALDHSLVNQIVETRDELSFHFENENVTIEGTHVATLPTETLRTNLVASVRQLRRDVIILEGIVDLARTKRELIRRIDDEVSSPLRTITNLIESERYETTCEYCP